LNEGKYVMQDAMMSVQGFCKKIGPAFDKYMPAFKDPLYLGLKTYDDVNTCNTCTMMVGSTLAHRLGPSFNKYIEEFLSLLYENLNNPDVDRKIKISILATFGDVALAIKGDFISILKPVLEVVQNASGIGFDENNKDDLDWVDYVNLLRDTVLETYQSILHGLHEGGKISEFPGDSVQNILGLIQRITNDYKNSLEQKMVKGQQVHQSLLVEEGVMKMAASTLSDLVQFFGADLVQHLKQAQYLKDLLEISRHGKDPDTREAGEFLMQNLKKFGGS